VDFIYFAATLLNTDGTIPKKNELDRLGSENRVKESIDQYESVIRHYPQNVVARTQLNTIKMVIHSVDGNSSSM
jgi:hypothetical protein